MGIRGRPSSADLAVISVSGLETIRRPRPPTTLTDEQGDEWRAIVNRMPADWFPRETHSILEQLCRHIVAARKVAQMIEGMEKQEGGTFELESYDLLLRMQQRESAAVASLMTKLRLSHQATMRHEKTRKPTLATPPWKD